MVTKGKFVILFRPVIVLMFSIGVLFPEGMAVKADDAAPPADTTTEASPPADAPSEPGGGEAAQPEAPAPSPSDSSKPSVDDSAIPPVEPVVLPLEGAPAPVEPIPSAENVPAPAEEIPVPVDLMAPAGDATTPINVMAPAIEAPAPAEVTVPAGEAPVSTEVISPGEGAPAPAEGVTQAPETASPAGSPAEDSIAFPLKDPAIPQTVVSYPAAETAANPAEVMDKLPDEAGLVLLDGQGGEVPLTAATAGEILANGDPMWCPGESAAGSPGCVPFGNLQDAIDYAQSDPANGFSTIYVESTYTSPDTSQLTIDQGDHPAVTLNMFVIGGVDLTGGSATYGKVIGKTILQQNVFINNISGGMTLANFMFEEFNFNSVTLNVENSNNVTLRNIDIDNTGPGNAIRVANSNHVLIDRTEVRDFDQGSGIMLTDVNNLIIRNTDVDEFNAGGGIYMNNVNNALLENLIVDVHDSGNNGSWPADSDAITAYNGSNLELRNVSATSNFSPGGWGLYAANVAGYVNIFGGSFENNNVDGIFIFKTDSVSLRNVVAWNNGIAGLYIHQAGTIALDNTIATSNGFMGADLQAAEGIALADSNFSRNGADGLLAFSDNGSITINGVKANMNGVNGADLFAGTNIKVSGSQFKWNGGYGLYGTALGNISLFDVTATANGGDGVSMHSLQNITASCSVFTDNESAGFAGEGAGPASTITLNSNVYSGNATPVDIFDGNLIENMNYPCGGSDPSGGGGAGGVFIHPMLAGLVPVTGGNYVPLSCSGISLLQLPTGEEAIFNQPMCGYQASMELVGEADLPSSISGGYEFVNGIMISLLLNSEDVGTLPAGASDTVIFPLTEGQSGTTFHVLHWDNTVNGGTGNWIDLGGAREALKWTKTHNQTGIFLLVK